MTSANEHTIGLCGVTPKDERMIQIILSRVPSARFKFTATPATLINSCDIALLDSQGAEATTHCERMKLGNPQLIVVTLADPHEEIAGYRISRRALWSQLVPTLDDVVHVELLHQQQRALQNPLENIQQPNLAPVADSSISKAHEGSPFKPGPLPSPLSNLGPLRALVLDDSVTVRTQLATALTKVGISADHASTADSAFALLDKHPFDFMFLDVIMPGVDGYDVCKQLRRKVETKKLPIVMLTSRSSPFDRARGALAGCDLYLTKPIDLKSFYQAVNKVVMKLFKNDAIAAQARGYMAAAA